MANDFGDGLARWAVTQWTLRERAKEKFALAERMLFVREALEQATHERVAAYRASRFPDGERVVDLTAGIGADLIGMSARGPATGFDLDPERAAYAQHNLAVHGLKADLRVADSLQSEWRADLAIADPARRTGGVRTSDPAHFAPPPDLVAERFCELRLACIKLTPMLFDRTFEALGGQVEFWSFGGECREAAVWLGTSVEPAFEPRAVHIESGESLPGGGDPPTTDDPEAFLFEADPAAIRAHALETLCDRHDLVGLMDSNGYLSGPERVDSVWLRGYRVLAHHPADPKATLATLRTLGSRTPIIKSRAPGVDVQALRHKLKSTGDRELIVAVCARGKKLRHVIVEPV